MDLGKDSSGFHCMRMIHSNNNMTYEAIQISEIWLALLTLFASDQFHLKDLPDPVP